MTPHDDPGRRAALPDGGAGRARVVLHDRLRRRVAVARAVGRREQVVDLELRHELARLSTRQLPRGDAERLLQRERGAERLDVFRPVEQEEIAVLAETDLAGKALELVE